MVKQVIQPMRRALLGVLVAVAAQSPLHAQQETVIREFNQAGPFAVSQPFASDTVDVNGKPFEAKTILDGISLSLPATGRFSGQVLPSLDKSRSVGLLTFYVNNNDYLKGKIEVKGPKNYKLFIDGTEATTDLSLAPEHHTFAIAYLAEPRDTDSIQVRIDANKAVAYTLDKHHPYMSHDLFDGKRDAERDRSAALARQELLVNKRAELDDARRKVLEDNAVDGYVDEHNMLSARGSEKISSGPVVEGDGLIGNTTPDYGAAETERSLLAKVLSIFGINI